MQSFYGQARVAIDYSKLEFDDDARAAGATREANRTATQLRFGAAETPERSGRWAGHRTPAQDHVQTAASASAPSTLTQQQRSASVPAPRVSKMSFYGEGFWPKSKSSLPPIFASEGGRRADQAVELDRRLRTAESLGDFIGLLSRSVSHLDIGNVVIALSCAAKLVDERSVSTLSSYPVWDSLLSQALRCADQLEPRGLSMMAHSAAKLSWKEIRLLQRLAATTVQKAQRFGATDIAKICWAFAKFGFVADAMDFWTAMEHEVEQKVCSGKFVDVSMIAWSFGQAELGGKKMYAEISRASLSMIEELPPQSLANIAWAFARVSISDAELFRVFSQRALAVVPDFVEFDVSNLCWALARADEVDFELFDQLATHTVKAGLVKRFSAQMLTQMVWAFAEARVMHMPLFEAMADFIAKHVSVFDTQQVANCAWSYAVVNAKIELALRALAEGAKGGKLWTYQQNELCAFCWAFAKLRWSDDELLRDMVQVASKRVDEFDGQSLANLLNSLVGMQQAGSAEGLPDFFGRLLDQVFAVVQSGQTYLEPEALAMAARSFCKAGRSTDAWALFERLSSAGTETGEAERSIGLQSFCAALLLEAERAKPPNAARAAQIWRRLALETAAPVLRAACFNCALMVLASAGLSAELHTFSQEVLALGLSNPVSNRLCPNGSGAHSATASWSTASRFNGSPQALDTDDNACLLAMAFNHAQPGDVQSVLSVMEEFGAERELLEVMAGGRASILDDVTAACRPKLMLEFGTHVGYASIRIAALVRQHNGHVITLEGNPMKAAVARNLIELAGLSSSVSSFVGHPDDCLAALQPAIARATVDMVLLHGGSESRFLAEFEQMEELGLVSPQCQVVADHVLRPGAPCFLWRMHSQPRYNMELVAITEPGIDRGEDWVAICSRRPERAAQEAWEAAPGTAAFPELALLTAESERLWRRRQAGEGSSSAFRGSCPMAEKFTRRFRDALERLGVAPTRHAEVQPSRLHIGCLVDSQSENVAETLEESQCVLPTMQASSFRKETGNFGGHASPDDSISAGGTKAGGKGQSNGDLAEMRDISFKEWLLMVLPSGELLEHCAALEEHYDTVAQIIKTYALPTKGGKVLDTRFFEDVPVVSRSHQDAFAQWFARECGFCILPAKSEELLAASDGLSCSALAEGAADQASSFVDATAVTPTSALLTLQDSSLRTLSFEEWLQTLDSSGSLAEYLGALQEEYDTVSQIVKTYTNHEDGKTLLDPQFFEDLGVKNDLHRELFSSWWKQPHLPRRGTSAGEASAVTDSVAEVAASVRAGITASAPADTDGTSAADASAVTDAVAELAARVRAGTEQSSPADTDGDGNLDIARGTSESAVSDDRMPAEIGPVETDAPSSAEAATGTSEPAVSDDRMPAEIGPAPSIVEAATGTDADASVVTSSSIEPAASDGAGPLEVAALTAVACTEDTAREDLATLTESLLVTESSEGNPVVVEMDTAREDLATLTESLLVPEGSEGNPAVVEMDAAAESAVASAATKESTEIEESANLAEREGEEASDNEVVVDSIALTDSGAEARRPAHDYCSGWFDFDDLEEAVDVNDAPAQSSADNGSIAEASAIKEESCDITEAIAIDCNTLSEGELELEGTNENTAAATGDTLAESAAEAVSPSLFEVIPSEGLLCRAGCDRTTSLIATLAQGTKVKVFESTSLRSPAGDLRVKVEVEDAKYGWVTMEKKDGTKYLQQASGREEISGTVAETIALADSSITLESDAADESGEKRPGVHGDTFPEESSALAESTNATDSGAPDTENAEKDAACVLSDAAENALHTDAGDSGATTAETMDEQDVVVQGPSGAFFDFDDLEEAGG